MPVVMSEPSGISAALTSAMTTTAGEMTSGIAAVLPIALPVAGGILVVFLGWKLFKRLTK